MTKLITAFTTPAPLYPGFINISREDDGSVVLLMRGDPNVREDSSYICGYAADKDKPGRCTPGDANCNNYCNQAPQLGPMVDQPKACTQTYCGEVVSVRLTAAEWQELLHNLLTSAAAEPVAV